MGGNTIWGQGGCSCGPAAVPCLCRAVHAAGTARGETREQQAQGTMLVLTAHQEHLLPGTEQLGKQVVGKKKKRKRGFTKGTAGLALLHAHSMLPGEVRCQSPAWLPTEIGFTGCGCKTPMLLHHPALDQLQPVWLSTPTPRPLHPGSPEGRSQQVSEHQVPEKRLGRAAPGAQKLPAAPALSDII